MHVLHAPERSPSRRPGHAIESLHPTAADVGDEDLRAVFFCSSNDGALAFVDLAPTRLPELGEAFRIRVPFDPFAWPLLCPIASSRFVGAQVVHDEGLRYMGLKRQLA